MFSLPSVLAIGALRWPDFAVLIVYLIASLLIGWVVGRNRSLNDYCLAGRQIPWWAACVSIVASDLSGVSYLGVPAWIYEHDLKYNFGILLMPLAMFLVILMLGPVFYHAGVYTVYDYLERRFHSSARTLTAILFLLKRSCWLAGAIYIPASALATATGISLLVCIAIIGGATTLYTMHGGMRSVIWTDFMQFIVLTGGLLVMIGIGLSAFGWSVPAVWDAAARITAPATNTPHTRLVDFSLGFKTEATALAILAFYLVYNVGSYGTDQVSVQRYLTVSSKREMFKSIMASSVLNIATVFLMAFLGLVLVVYYHARPELAATLPKPDLLVPHFVMNVLPVGLRGLIFAAIFAATMSVVSAALNSFATVGVVDLYRKYSPSRSDDHYVRMAQLFTVAGGAVTTAAAVWVSHARTSIIQTVAVLESIFVGPITGMFFLGIFTRRANLAGVFVGIVAGLVVGLGTGWEPIASRVSWMWTAPLSCLATYMAGYIASLALAPWSSRRAAGAPVAPEPIGPTVLTSEAKV